VSAARGGRSSTEIAVIADTHLPRGSRRLPDACVERLRGAELVIHAGDFSTAAARDEIASLCHELVAVHGNVDDDRLRAELPERVELERAGARIGVIHDAGPRQGRLGRMRRAFPECDAVIFGHSHLPLHERDGAFQIFNPGSPTERRRAPAHTMGVAAIHDGEIRFELVRLS
jgi:putative phosphoesterase